MKLAKLIRRLAGIPDPEKVKRHETVTREYESCVHEMTMELQQQTRETQMETVPSERPAETVDSGKGD